MSSPSGSAARSFIDNVVLPEPPREEEVALEGVAFDFDQAKNQALVVGSDIVSFVKGVTEEQRHDIVNSTLLAQLVAKKRVPDANKVTKWYDAYFDTLSNIGWVIQERHFEKFSGSSQSLEAHEAILAIAATLLGPGSAALQVIKSTLNALKTMKSTSPWITLFNRESQKAKTARFQITLAERAADGQFLVTLMAFGLVAKSSLTQVLFFKFRMNDVELKHSSGKVTINAEVLASVRDAIATKLKAFTGDFVRGLPDLG